MRWLFALVVAAACGGAAPAHVDRGEPRAEGFEPVAFGVDVRGAAPVLIVAADGGLQHRIRAQVAAIPHREVVVVPGTRHFVMFDDPPKFFAAIDRFLAAHPARRSRGS